MTAMTMCFAAFKEYQRKFTCGLTVSPEVLTPRRRTAITESNSLENLCTIKAPSKTKVFSRLHKYLLEMEQDSSFRDSIGTDFLFHHPQDFDESLCLCCLGVPRAFVALYSIPHISYHAKLFPTSTRKDNQQNTKCTQGENPTEWEMASIVYREKYC